MANATAARKPAASRKAKGAATDNVPAATAPASNVPALVPGAPVASNLPANGPAMAGAAPLETPAAGWPAADNGNAWLALLTAAVPATLEARGYKYGEGKGMLPVANVRYNLSPIFGREAADNGGKGKSGKHTVQALLCVAHKMAQAATGSETPCGAAVAYFAYTAPVLALLQPPVTKTAKYVGKPKAGSYNVPCPRWVSDYMRGNARSPALLFGVAG